MRELRFNSEIIVNCIFLICCIFHDIQRKKTETKKWSCINNLAVRCFSAFSVSLSMWVCVSVYLCTYKRRKCAVVQIYYSNETVCVLDIKTKKNRIKYIYTSMCRFIILFCIRQRAREKVASLLCECFVHNVCTIWI